LHYLLLHGEHISARVDEVEPMDDLARSLRHEAREAAEELEADVREADLLARSLADAAFELGEDAARVNMTVAGRAVAGVVIHAGEDVVTLADASGGTAHIRLAAIADIRIDDRGRGRTTPRIRDPRTFQSMLAHAQVIGTALELNGPELGSLAGIVIAVAADHVVLESAGRRHIVPISAIASASVRSGG